MPKLENLHFHFHAKKNLKHSLDVLSSVAGWFTLPMFKGGQLIEQGVASSSFWAVFLGVAGSVLQTPP